MTPLGNHGDVIGLGPADDARHRRLPADTESGGALRAGSGADTHHSGNEAPPNSLVCPYVSKPVTGRSDVECAPRRASPTVGHDNCSGRLL